MDAEQLVDPALDRLQCLDRCRVRGVDLRERSRGEVVVDRVRQYEVPVAQSLHEGRRAEPVGSVVGEVGLAGHVQPSDRALEVVVDPQPAHRVVDGRVDPHRHLVRVLARDLQVHVEQVPVARLDDLLAQPVDRIGEVQVDAAAHVARVAVEVLLGDGRADTATLVAHVLRLAGRDVAWHQVAERRIDPLQVVVAVSLGDLPRVLGAVLGLLGHPDASVVTQRLAHQRELGLRLAVDRDARRVDLRVAGVPEVRALAVGAPSRCDVAAHRVRGQEEDVAVAAGGEDDRVGEPGLDRTGDHVAGHDAARLAVGDDQLDHLVTAVHRHRPGRDLALERLVRADEQLLARLAASVEGALHLDAAEGASVEQAAVLACERHALGDALVDDVGADFGEPIDVRLTGAVVAALDGVVEQPLRRVVVVAVVLRGVDAALGCDGVGAARAVLVAEVEDVVARLAEGRGSGSASQPCADDDDGELAAVGRVDELGLELTRLPHLLDVDVRGLGVGDLVAEAVVRQGRVDLLDAGLLGRGGGGHLIPPNRTATGMAMKAANRRTDTKIAV